MEYTEQIILDTLNHSFLASPKYLINNLFVFFWESDYLALTKAGYWYEIEVKISRSDFKADFKKKGKHESLSGLMMHGGSNLRNPNYARPNYFYYAVPENMISVEEAPEYAGLLYVCLGKYGTIIKTVKKAPTLHKDKLNLDLSDKFYYNWLTEKEKVKKLKREIEDLKRKYKNSNV